MAPPIERPPSGERLPSSLLARSLLLVALSASGLACGEAEARTWAMRPISAEARFPARDAHGAVMPAGKLVSAQDLDEGRMSYVSFCAPCHGLDGDGRGPDSAGMDPPPRDFRTATFKFAAVRSGELPNDADFLRVIRSGIAGTQMPGWGLDTEELYRIADFIKTFPPPECAGGAEPCGRTGPWLRALSDGRPARSTGEPVRATPDPWAGRHGEAARKGEEIYHLTAQCTACHPSYLGEEELLALARRAGRPTHGSRSRPDEPLPLAADKNPYHDEILPPDFTKDASRSIRPDHEQEDLYRVVAAGIGGVMPAWVDALPDDEVWALVHYVSAVRRCGKRLTCREE
jgi:mono/diheme cytochrome c family protein